MSVDFPAPEGPMIPMSSRWQNFPDKHLRRVLYPGGREQHRFDFPEQQCYRDCDAIPAPGGPQDVHASCQGLHVPANSLHQHSLGYSHSSCHLQHDPSPWSLAGPTYFQC